MASRAFSCLAVASVFLASGCATGGSGGPPAASGATSATQPFGGAPAAIPGKVEAEHFDEGPEGVACHDVDPENQGAPYRSTSADVEARPDASNGHGIGWTRGGEWLIYTVEVATGRVERLTYGEGDNENAAWSPDGRWLVFTSTRRGKPELFIMGADGSLPRPVGALPGRSFTPDWMP